MDEDDSDSSDSQLSYSPGAVDTAYREVLDDIMTDVVMEFCFEVHQAVKLGSFFSDGIENNIVEKHVEDRNKDIFGNMVSKIKCSTINCPQCNEKKEATHFAPHLAKCMGGGRISSRIASKRVENIVTQDNYLDEDDENDSDFSYTSYTKKKAKKKQKKTLQGKVKRKRGESVSEPSGDMYKDMSYEERREFMDQHCGVISKHTGRRCMKTLRCSQHAEEQKREVRSILFTQGPMADQLPDDVQIDVDTVDEENYKCFRDQPVSISPTPVEIIPTSSSFKKEERKIIISISRNAAGQFQRKKTSYDHDDFVIKSSQSTSAGHHFDDD